jgi:hypothetical protein
MLSYVVRQVPVEVKQLKLDVAVAFVPQNIEDLNYEIRKLVVILLFKFPDL